MSSDVTIAFDRALQAPRGVRAIFPTKSAAESFRSRAYKFRERDRKADPDGISEYDELMISLVEHEGKWCLVITRPDPLIEEIEE